MKLQVKPTGRAYKRHLLVAVVITQGVVSGSLSNAQEPMANVRPAEAVRIAKGFQTQPEKRKINAGAERGYTMPPTPIDVQATEPITQAVAAESRPVELIKRRSAKVSVASRDVPQSSSTLTAPQSSTQLLPAPVLEKQFEVAVSAPLAPTTPLTAPVHTLQLPPQQQLIASAPAAVDIQIVEPPQLILPPIQNGQRGQQASVASATASQFVPPIASVPQSQVSIARTSHITHSDQAVPSAFDSASIGMEDAKLDTCTIYHRRLTSNKFEQVVAKAVSHDESTCRAFVVDSHTIALLGVRPGQAKIDIQFADGTKSSRLISVENAHSGGTPADHNEKIASLTSSLSEMYPNASISLKSESNGSIAVRGELRTENDARDVMLLVRQVFLVPIQDKLIVSYR